MSNCQSCTVQLLRNWSTLWWYLLISAVCSRVSRQMLLWSYYKWEAASRNPTSQIPPQKPLESMKDMKYDWIWTELWSEWKLLWAPLPNQAKLLPPYYFSTKKKLLLPWIKLMFGRESSEKDGTDVSRTIPCKEMAATVCNRIVEIITRGWNFMWSKTIVQMELF